MSPSSSSCSMTVDGVSSLPGGEDEVRLGVDDELDVDLGLDHDVGHVGHLGRVVVEVGHADQPVAGVERADDLRVRGGQADDPLGLGFDRDACDRRRRSARRERPPRRSGSASPESRSGAVDAASADGLVAGGRARADGEEENQEGDKGMPGMSHVMSVPFTRGWRHRDSAGRPGSHASHRSDGTADTVAGLRRLLTGFAIYPSVFRRTAPTASSSVDRPMLARTDGHRRGGIRRGRRPPRGRRRGRRAESRARHR